MLQAYVDDSGNLGQGKTSVLAGFVASTEAWADFSDRWAATLKAAPPIDYFKASEAFGLVKQFHGWTGADRDRKVSNLCAVILATDISYGVAAVLFNDDYKNTVPEGTGLPLGDPFYFLFTNVMQICMLHQRNSQLHEKVDFIFDTASKPLQTVAQQFSVMMFSAPENVKSLGIVENPPIFRDEKQFVPIQAADLLAGHIRRHYEKAIDTDELLALSEKFKIARTEQNSTHFRTILKGAELTRAFVQSGAPEESLERFLQFKAALEELTRLERNHSD